MKYLLLSEQYIFIVLQHQFRYNKIGETMKRRKKRKLRMKRIMLFVIVLVIVFLGGYLYYTSSTRYQLQKLGYQKNEIKVLETLDAKQLSKVLKLPYEKILPDLLQETYFIDKNLERYLAYQKKNTDLSAKEIITMVNVNRDKAFYNDVTKTDTAKGKLMLVNKYYALGKDYQPKNLVSISNQYGYGTNSIEKEVFNHYLEMFQDAKKEGLTLIVTSSYRDYDYQEELWNQYKNQKGQEWADSISARAGQSEHQTGYTMDIATYGSVFNDFENTDEFKWMEKNAHKYGFILRYPKGKEDITGYDYESWHYRYVGVDTATKVHNLGITYDEYYAYYIEQNKNS